MPARVSTTSDASGTYSFANVPNGTFAVREIVPTGYAAMNVLRPTVTGGAVVNSANLANEATVYSGGASADHYLLRKSGVGKFEIVIAGAVQYTVSASIPSLAFNLGGGDDVLTIDCVNGTPAPSGGVSCDGGSGTGDQILVAGISGTPDNADFGSASLTLNESSVAIANVESFQFDGQGGWDYVSVGGTASVTLPGVQQLAALTVSGTAIASLRPVAQGGATLVIRSLDVVGSSARLDIADDDVIVDYSSLSPVGTWNGTAYDGVSGWIASGAVMSSNITSSLNAVGVAEAYQALGNTGTQTALLAGQTIDSSAVLVKYTYAGDATLDGKINVDDYGRIDFFSALGGSGWYNGDFNLDGKVNVDDYGIIDFNVGIQGPGI
jgi:hypothetical protein